MANWLGFEIGPPDFFDGGVYALYRNGIVVYVGQTEQAFYKRCLAHRKRFRFDTIKIRAVPNRFQRLGMERKLIARLRPVENRYIPTRRDVRA